MSLRERTFNATKWASMINVSAYLGQFVLQLAIAHILGPEVFGLAARIIAIAIILDQAAELGFTAALVQRPQLRPAHSSTAFTANLLIAATITGLAWASVSVYGTISGWSEFLQYLRFVLPLPLVIALSNVQRAL